MIMRNINLILEIKRSVPADRRTKTLSFRSNVNNAKFDDVYYFFLASLTKHNHSFLPL